VQRAANVGPCRRTFTPTSLRSGAGLRRGP
jgi:hypothetical protein